MRKKLKLNNKFLTFGLGLMIPVSLIGGTVLLSASNERTSADSDEYLTQYTETVPITNSNFVSGANPTASGNLTGWTIKTSGSTANGMIIDVGDENFSKYNQNSYYLDQNPGKIGGDNKILMINSKSSKEPDGNWARMGYTSENITLKSNSRYKLSVKALTSLNGGDRVTGSIYLSGLKDEKGKDITFSYENISNSSWANYYFFITTGNEEQTVTLDLYLGTKDAASAGGVVFYDDVTLEKFSENFYYENLQAVSQATERVKSLDLSSAGSEIKLSGVNFDFEDELTGVDPLGQSWSKLATGVSLSKSHAKIMPVINIQPSQFRSETGYGFAGSTFSNGNTKALVMYTDKGYSSHFTVQSNDIEVKAHGIYKISAYVKVSEMNEGSFFVQVKENDNIYTLYDFDEDFYKTSSAITGSITSGSDKFVNGYQKVDFYVKGHEFFDTSVNLQFVFGSEETPASGCVFVDDVSISYVKYDEFKDASNKLELTTISETPTFTNGFFNETENEEAALAYPLKATGWTLEQNPNTFVSQEAGVVYLDGQAKFREMYKDKSWGGIYPGHPSGLEAQNNVYMMYSEGNYQSLTSSSVNLAKNSFHMLSFNFQTISNTAKDASITIEIKDESGMLLYREKGLSSERQWATKNIYFRTAENAANNVQISILFGEEREKMSGTVYLDNFKISQKVTEDTFNKAENKVDLADYYLNLDVNGTIGSSISDSTAYKFSSSPLAETSSITGVGGIVKGSDNEFGIEVEDSNLLVISNLVRSESSLTSVYNVSTEADGYYKLTFDLRTSITDKKDGGKNDDHKECKFGLSAGLKNFDMIEGLISEGEFTTYTIYFKASSAQSSQIVFTLRSDCTETLGNAYITHLNFETSSADELARAREDESFDKTVFASNAAATPDETPDDEPSNDENANKGDNSSWLLIPSLIFAAAVIIAIVGFGVRHIKFKKTEKVREESYNRRISVDHDLTLKEAHKIRDEEVEKLNNTKAELIKQKTDAEEAHKEAVKEARLNSKGKITKDAEREFKAYANKVSRLQEKIDILNEQIETALSPDHLMNLEQRISEDEVRRIKEARKESRSKEAEKLNKKSDEK